MTREELAYRRRWAILFVLCFSLLVIVLDNTILNVAIPTIVRELHASNSQVQWMVDSYALVFAGLLLTAGSLGDRFGRRGALQLGLVIFGAGSGAAALANDANTLIATRACMGIGSAFIMPATLSIITNVFPARERGKAIGVWAGTAGIGAAIGPLTGGFLLEHFYWGSIFLVNIPIVIFGLLAGVLLIPTSKDPSVPRLDLVGAALSIVGLSTLVSGTDFLDSNSANKVLTALDGASTSLRAESSALGSNLSIVQIRQDFNKNLINVLQTGASNLTLADTNEEAANSQALSTRQSIAVSALALANQSQQSVLKLLQ